MTDVIGQTLRLRPRWCWRQVHVAAAVDVQDEVAAAGLTRQGVTPSTSRSPSARVSCRSPGTGRWSSCRRRRWTGVPGCRRGRGWLGRACATGETTRTATAADGRRSARCARAAGGGPVPVWSTPTGGRWCPQGGNGGGRHAEGHGPRRRGDPDHRWRRCPGHLRRYQLPHDAGALRSRRAACCPRQGSRSPRPGPAYDLSGQAGGDGIKIAGEETAILRCS